MGSIEHVIRFALVIKANKQAITGSKTAIREGPPCNNCLVSPITQLSLLVVRT